MSEERSRLQPSPDRRQRLEDQYKKIGIPALAAAVGTSRPKAKDVRRTSEDGPEWMVLEPQS
jgi:hypothetical protein